MQSAVDSTRDSLRLLSSLDLGEVVEIAAEIILALSQADAVAVLVWDRDLESVSDRLLFGPRKKELAKFAEAFARDFAGGEKDVEEVDEDEVDARLDPTLSPVFGYRIAKEEHLCAYVLIAGADGGDAGELAEAFAPFPFATAFDHAWEFRELSRENERLRSQYDQLEDSNRSMEEQTRKLIHDIMSKDSLHTKTVERDRLVYSISNQARSSLKIQEVLQSSVNSIGKTLGVSRCLLLRPLEGDSQLAVYEFTGSNYEPVSGYFQAEAGIRFMHSAMGRSVPQYLGDPELEEAPGFERDFLKQMKLRSGLIVPLIMRENVIGSLFLQDCNAPRDWNIDDISLLGALADQLSIAIENADLHEERERQARMDGLTGVANRRHFAEMLALEFERARRYGETLSLIVADLDFLKKINDTWGHQAGDEAIKSIARVMRQSSRAIDLPARYGGEEFCLLLPNTDLEMAGQIAERLRRLISEQMVEGPGSISASIGVASYPLHASDPEELFQRADAALYQAKQAGRNRVCVAQVNLVG